MFLLFLCRCFVLYPISLLLCLFRSIIVISPPHKPSIHPSHHVPTPFNQARFGIYTYIHAYYPAYYLTLRCLSYIVKNNYLFCSNFISVFLSFSAQFGYIPYIHSSLKLFYFFVVVS
ncbi:hypothetical protein BDZ97DRAFT_72494 [Flammula alnicola]|nr:hypothetical protein BDZ97DRAFT_72494 [Flammula alnicola]